MVNELSTERHPRVKEIDELLLQVFYVYEQSPKMPRVGKKLWIISSNV